MKLNEVRIFPVSNAGSLKASATLEFKDENGTFWISGVKVIETKKGLFVGMPSQKFQNKEGQTEYRDLVIWDKKLRELLSKRVLTEYKTKAQEPTL